MSDGVKDLPNLLTKFAYDPKCVGWGEEKESCYPKRQNQDMASSLAKSLAHISKIKFRRDECEALHEGTK